MYNYLNLCIFYFHLFRNQLDHCVSQETFEYNEVTSTQFPEVVEKFDIETQTTEGYGGRTAEIFYNETGVQVDTIDADSYDFAKTLLKSDYNVSKCCGIPNLKVLDWLDKCCQQLLPNDKSSCSMKKRILITCRKLRTNLSFTDISIEFNLTKTSCAKYFHDTIQVLSKVSNCLIYWPTNEENSFSLPQCFNEYPKTQIVLDCTEVKIESLQCLDCRTCTYSHYKGGHTVKYLIGVTPSGLVSYISPGYAGRSTDQTIFEKCDIISKLDDGDAIMVDKGFLIQRQCTEAGIILYRPPFLQDGKLSKEESELTASIARARVHVERKIARLKNFKILTEKVVTTLLPYIDDILVVISGLCNLETPILAKNKF